MASDELNKDSTPTVLGLLFLFIILVLALVYLYKKLNADTNGQYTVQRLVFAPGGLRDRLRQGVGVVENRFGVRIWPEPRDDEESIRENDEEGEDHDKQNDNYTEEGEQNENDDGDDDSSSDYSSIDLRERAKMQTEEKKSEKNKAKEEEEKEEEEEEEGAAGQDDKSEEIKNEEKLGLLVDLKPFTGSAIWSEENKDGNDMTAL